MQPEMRHPPAHAGVIFRSGIGRVARRSVSGDLDGEVEFATIMLFEAVGGW
jgi:hypothetical protein